MYTTKPIKTQNGGTNCGLNVQKILVINSSLGLHASNMYIKRQSVIFIGVPHINLYNENIINTN